MLSAFMRTDTTIPKNILPRNQARLMEISTAMMQHILRLTEGYTDLLNELKEVKAELKGEKLKKPTIHETKYPHMSIITRK